MKYLNILLFLTFTSFSLSLRAQEKASEKLSLNSGTINNQFEYVIQKSNNYKDYKVIKKAWLYTLKSNTLDSLKAIHEELSKTQQTVENQAIEITDLKDNLAKTQITLDQTNEEKDNMSLFGMQMSKGGYNTLMWSIIGALLALLLLFIYKFKNSNAITKQAKQALADTEKEFEEHRRIALEREQKVRRQLQDEINKHKNRD